VTNKQNKTPYSRNVLVLTQEESFRTQCYFFWKLHETHYGKSSAVRHLDEWNPKNVKGQVINEQKDKPTTKKYLRNNMRYKKTVGLFGLTSTCTRDE